MADWTCKGGSFLCPCNVSSFQIDSWSHSYRMFKLLLPASSAWRSWSSSDDDDDGGGDDDDGDGSQRYFGYNLMGEVVQLWSGKGRGIKEKVFVCV